MSEYFSKSLLQFLNGPSQLIVSLLSQVWRLGIVLKSFCKLNHGPEAKSSVFVESNLSKQA